MNTNLKSIYHKVDLCVVGGGLAGMCAAVAAARHGIKVALMHDRPVYGGNASSEIRMWVCGAHGKNNRETGIIEEIALETLTEILTDVIRCGTLYCLNLSIMKKI